MHGIFFCSQGFKKTSNALNFDANIVNIEYCFDCFLPAGGDKVGSLADAEFTLSLLQVSFVLVLL